MKFSKFLVIEIKRLVKLHNIKKMRRTKTGQHCVDPEVNKRIIQLFKLTNFLLDEKYKNYRNWQSRLHYLEHGFSVCSMCSGEVYSLEAMFCSRSCVSLHFLKWETQEAKLKRVTKSANSRDYADIVAKRLKTQRTDIDEQGQNGLQRMSFKGAETLRHRVDDNGTNGNQLRAQKAAITKQLWSPEEKGAHRKKLSEALKRSDKSNNFWNTATQEERQLSTAKRNASARKTNEKTGYWRKQKNIPEYELYYKACEFNFGFKSNAFTTKEEKELLKKYGVFNNKNNTKGVVRDHLLSRRFGFENQIHPDIISHPANCEIVLHAENVRRRSMKTGDNQISLNELLDRINEFNKYK